MCSASEEVDAQKRAARGEISPRAAVHSRVRVWLYRCQDLPLEPEGQQIGQQHIAAAAAALARSSARTGTPGAADERWLRRESVIGCETSGNATSCQHESCERFVVPADKIDGELRWSRS